MLESVLILSQGSPTVSSDVEAILEFETNFAKVLCIFLYFMSYNNYGKSFSKSYITQRELELSIYARYNVRCINSVLFNLKHTATFEIVFVNLMWAYGVYRYLTLTQTKQLN